MASAVKTSIAKPLESSPKELAKRPGWFLRTVDSTYRFLASVKLAVISLGSLAAVLGYATFFEAAHGTPAVQEWIYQSKGFSVLLAFLGANILCAALIRYPWKKRQTGFVVTHAGLLIVLGGSWYGLHHTIEGEVSENEGEVKHELIQTESPLIRVQELDPHNPEVPVREWEFPFRPGNFAWGPGIPRERWWFEAFNPLALLDKEDRLKPSTSLTKPSDPFQLVARSFIPASVTATLHEAGPSGHPMAKIEPHFKAPNMAKPMEMFDYDGDRWFEASPRFFREARNRIPSTGRMVPALIAFSYVDRPELVEDFLSPPKVEGEAGAVRLRYRDRTGRDRSFDWSLEGQKGKSIVLPDSDLKIVHEGVEAIEAATFELDGRYDEPIVPFATFHVSQGDKAPARYLAGARLPMLPNLFPDPRATTPVPAPVISINYHLPPVIDQKTNGLFGAIEILAGPGGKLFYRVFGRSKDGSPTGVLRDNKGEVEIGKEITAFGGNPGMPMTISFHVAEYLASGVKKSICEPITLPKNQQGLSASQFDMVVREDGKEVKKEFYLHRSPTFEPTWKTINVPSGSYRLALDYDRKPLGFDVKLEDFEITFDPGTDQASSYVSRVLVTDKAKPGPPKPVTISMNEPMNHNGYTFYQSSYQPEEDPRTRQKTGRFSSVFHVRYDPAWTAKYAGCLLVVLGAFIQFYMRAGLFTDGGKRERAKAEVKNGQPDKSVAVVQEPPTHKRRADAEDIL